MRACCRTTRRIPSEVSADRAAAAAGRRAERACVLLDDVGFAASSAFGGPCATPTAERLAAEGSSTPASTRRRCARRRAQALLTGRNHHAVGMGLHHRARDIGARLQLDPPQHVLRRSRDPQAERVLDGAVRQVPRSAGAGRRARWGRSTHGRPVAVDSSTSTASSAARPTSTTPRSTRARRRSSPPKTPEEGYHFTEDMTDKAITWVRQQKSLMPDKPFFVYFAPGAAHAPHHVPTEWSDKYKGRFDAGWDCAARGDLRPPEGARRDPCRRGAHRAARGDPGVGRHARRAEARPRPPDGGLRRRSSRTPTTTSGGSSTRSTTWGSSTTRSSTTSSATTARRRRARSTARSTRRSSSTARRPSRQPSSWRRSIDEFGGPEAYNHYAVGWAHAMDTPYQWTKQVASHWGGTRNGTIVHWPNGLHGAWRGALAVLPRHRRRADRSRGRRAARADVRERRPADAASTARA